MDTGQIISRSIALRADLWSRHGEAEQSDEELVEGILRRRPEALCWLYGRYKSLVIAVARQILLDPDEAQETSQDVFLQVWNHAGRFDARRGAFKGWISGLTRCRAIDRFRRRRREDAAREIVRGEFARKATERFEWIRRTAHTPTLGDDDRMLLLDAVASLPAEQTQVVLLTYMQGMSQREISKHLGLTLGIVKHRLKGGMHAMIEMSPRLKATLAA